MINQKEKLDMINQKENSILYTISDKKSEQKRKLALANIAAEF